MNPSSENNLIAFGVLAPNMPSHVVTLIGPLWRRKLANRGAYSISGDVWSWAWVWKGETIIVIYRTGLCSTDCSQTWGKHQWRNRVFNHPMSTVVHDDGQKQTYLPGPGLNNRYAIYNLSNLYTLSTFSDVGPPHEIASNWLLPHSGIA